MLRTIYNHYKIELFSTTIIPHNPTNPKGFKMNTSVTK